MSYLCEDCREDISWQCKVSECSNRERNKNIIFEDEEQVTTSLVVPEKFKGSQKDLNLALSMFSCFDCVGHENCEYAWDHYNTNGDCLAEK